MTANVRIATSESMDVLKVPSSVFRYNPPGKESGNESVANKTIDAKARRIWIMRDDNPRGVFVTTGITDGSYAAINGTGIKEGDEVILDIQKNTNENKNGAQSPPRGMLH